MSFFRTKTITKNGKKYSYLYRQTSVREGKRVRSVMEYLGALGSHGPETTGRSVPNRNADLKVSTNPQRPDHTAEHRRGLFKTNKEEFDRLHAFDAARTRASKESKAAWKEKSMGRAEKQERDQVKQSADAKFKETMEVIREFNEARGKEKEPPSDPPGGS